MWSLSVVEHILRRRVARKPPRELATVANRSWEIAPAETAFAPPAVYLPNQLERVTGWAFADEHPKREMEGGYSVRHAGTRGLMVENAFLIDGTLYKNGASLFLNDRSKRLPTIRVEREIERAAVYCTPGGNRYFGQWLMDDCPTYPLAAGEGTPVTTAQELNPHTLAYEDWLGLKPQRVSNAFFRQLVFFEDYGQNSNKHRRFCALGEKLASHVEHAPHPGVFIVRGTTGQRRVLRNEMEIAEQLRDRRGFRILDPARSDLPTIVRTCAGAKMVVGVEGSGLIHGILLLPPRGGVLALQPPTRFVTLYKHLTDRDGQHFGFVVGKPDGEGDDFRVDLGEVERTLDLFPGVSE